MSKQEDAARLISTHLSSKEKLDNVVCFDPLTIIMLIGLIVNIVRLWRDCHQNSTDAVKEFTNPGIVMRTRLRTAVRRSIRLGKIKGLAGRDTQLATAILEVGKTLPIEFMKELFAEVA